MSGQVEISVTGAMGVITLDRPEAINALTSAMIIAISKALEGWKVDDRVRAVLIEGRGEKGLCAGGDVRAIREFVLDGRIEDAHRFFSLEYAMNHLIATYNKPIVALQHGIVMGGGIGLSSHARYRVATANSRFAMPEAAIGFFCDVGVNAILCRAPAPRALAFLVSGRTVGAADAIALGLSDTMVPANYLEGLRERLIDCAKANDVDIAIGATLQGESIEPGETGFCALADTLADIFDLPDMVSMLGQLDATADDGDPGAAALAHGLSSHCPTSLAVILASHRLARRQRDIGSILATDLELARTMCLRPDFSEGVRAVLVDKDKKPSWTPSVHAAVDLKFTGLDFA